MNGNGVDQDAQPVLNNWRLSMFQFNMSQEDLVSVSSGHCLPESFQDIHKSFDSFYPFLFKSLTFI